MGLMSSDKGASVRKNMKTLLLILLLILVTFSTRILVFTPTTVNATSSTKLQVINPLTGDKWFNFTTSTKRIGDTFLVNITVVNVAGLNAWQINFTWDEALVNYVSVQIPVDNVFSQSGLSLIAPAPKVGLGYVVYGCSYVNAPPYWTFNGTGTLCQVRLIIRDEPINLPLSCNLALFNITYDTFLLDMNCRDIPFDAEDGSYNFRAGAEVPSSFAIIADLHIGRGYSNYNGESYYLTDRLQKVVKWIKDNASTYNIKFVVVLGDITEHGTQTETQKAKTILDELGRIPYLPVIGNHDHNSSLTGRDQDDQYFDSVFDTAFYDDQHAKLGEDCTRWKYERTIIPEPNDPTIHLHNYAFEFQSKNFVFLDFVDRTSPLGMPKLESATMNFLEAQLFWA